MKESEMKKKICPEYSSIVTIYDGITKQAVVKEIEINCKGVMCAAWVPETIIKQDSGHCSKMTGK